MMCFFYLKEGKAKGSLFWRDREREREQESGPKGWSVGKER